ncbi:MAG: uncharacterized protein V7607_5004 [Solirubrobacteraceae bacterium]
MRVSAIELTAPIITDEAGAPVVMPAPQAPRATAAGGRWTITRDPVRDRIEVVIGRCARELPAGDGDRLDVRSEVRATVRRAAPDEALTTGHHTAVLHRASGELVSVNVLIRCTQAALWARGEVTVDDTALFSQVWEAPLSHPNAPASC